MGRFPAVVFDDLDEGDLILVTATRPRQQMMAWFIDFKKKRKRYFLRLRFNNPSRPMRSICTQRITSIECHEKAKSKEAT